ncbi:M24 family metallopeptidase [Mesoplasma whartonense]|uniref:M24 family metallopeptidase n=1 Tax=Mesoplasma whartonense TaxID=2878854 RepID=UPI0020229EDE|nr:MULTISPECIES: Xaa-Pro peptidase family protein [unclassified Mesoplasma]MCL8212859.1 Aminopeptidase YpdF [Mesoplasma sp. JKS002661]MCL8213108.1 Aminopeptidase YpdF [Mesoplasma sp. JKS002660]MCL8216058.1 Aminopeptidase YpdF [Mesoplasma sp. JKS002657]
MSKQAIIQNLLTTNGVEAILITSEQNRFWYTAFPSSLGYLLITKKGSYLFLDGRYITAARESKTLQNVNELFLFKGDLFAQIKQILVDQKVKSLGFESDWTIYQDYLTWTTKFNQIELIPVNTNRIRMIKDEKEIQALKKAAEITHKVFLEVLGYVRPGITERMVATFVSDAFLRNGADKLSFDTIVASGVNGSKPHAVPSDKVIEAGEFVTLDMGCYFQGYASDQTRTFLVGEHPSNPELLKVYDVVYQAQSLGISLLKPGVLCGDIHQEVDKFIASQGYQGYFTHGLGHGLGIEIHEEPYENPVGDVVLAPGMTLTVEPGIYLPGVGGVRIEDDFVITAQGAEALTTPLRELQKIK